MFDVLVRNGLVVGPYGSSFADVAIVGETIVAVAPHGTLVAEAAHVVDATGKIVVPGGIDPHIHSKWPIPSAGGAPPVYTADIEQVSRAAVYGGTTMLLDFAVWEPGERVEDTLVRREKDFAGSSYCDYAYHVMLTGAIPPEIVDELPAIVAAGHSSVKIFTTDITPSRRGRKVTVGHIWEVLQRLAKAGGIAAIHAEDDELVMHMYDRLTRENRTHFTNMPEAHSSLSEDLAFRRIIRLAEHVEGAVLYMMHVSAKEGIDAIAESRAKGFPIYGETLHQYAMFSADDAYFRPNGQIYHTYPSLKYDRDRRSLWQGMSDGTIGTIATDELCTLLELKTRGVSIEDVTGGNSGVEPRMGIMYTEAVTARGFSLQHFVDLTSANAARYFGMYPRKGALLEGSDADICVLDPSARFVLKKEHLHETDYSPWEGWTVTGWPVATIVRGKIVMQNGKLLGERSWGRWIPRKISEGVLFGPRQASR
jgi:dihydropyrimidinase